MKKPLVSVICTNFNKGQWISQAIKSFLLQKTEFNFEILVIDDASTDGSRNIIRKIHEDNPDRIRLFENKKNLGITRTWKKICQEAKGKYIARCDGDDFWIDEYKLQKQVDLLENSLDSKWCNSDFRTINESGEILYEKSFQQGFIDMPRSFSEVLVGRGFTNASTWLIDSDLMRKVNSKIPDDAIDDTFNIQLELFLETKLSTLRESTAVYRINDGSDSRPLDRDRINNRRDNLLKTQIDYLSKLKSDELIGLAEKLLIENSKVLSIADDRLYDIKSLEKRSFEKSGFRSIGFLLYDIFQKIKEKL